jgi:hypothetical protein
VNTEHWRGIKWHLEEFQKVEIDILGAQNPLEMGLLEGMRGVQCAFWALEGVGFRIWTQMLDLNGWAQNLWLIGGGCG